jgi:microcystin-dependent protein
MADTYLGDVRAMSFNFAPNGWAKCEGQLLPIGQNQALYALLGSRYGGDGRTSFGLPALAPVPAQGGTSLIYCIALRGSMPIG